MKKTIVAVAVAIVALMGFNNAWAEMVDIGTGQMEQSEFQSLKTMVREGRMDAIRSVSTPLTNVERYGPVEMSPADFNALRDKVAGVEKVQEAPSIVTPPVRMVNIGTGEMPLDDFLALKQLVRGSHAFVLEQMAAMLP